MTRASGAGRARHRPKVIRACLAVLLAAIGPRAGAQGLIGTGLDWSKGVRVQELWAGGRPLFALANLGSAPVAISVHERASGRRRAGPWRLEPGAVATVDARAVQGADLVELRLESGRSLGLLDAPPAGGAGVPASSGVVVTTDGLNGSGGRHTDLWLGSRPSGSPAVARSTSR